MTGSLCDQAPQEERCESNGFSDPYIGLQVQELQRYAQNLEQREVPSSDIETDAQYANEWTRAILSKTFGRTTPDELSVVTGIFDRIAKAMKRLIETPNVHATLCKRAKPYVDKIKERAEYSVTA